jgi:GrpB-like predicted nucleotidyltransferase (UPF0157 family)
MPASPLEIAPYDQRWPARANAELQELTASLGSLVVYADHIGSTSVPLTAAKNILDLQKLAAAVGDLDVYTEIKDPVVDLVVAAAGQWIREVDWQPHGALAAPATPPPAPRPRARQLAE